MIFALIFATNLLGPLAPVPQHADSTYVNPSMCPPRYVPVPQLYCRLGGVVWHEQGAICHDNQTERRPGACLCQMENVPANVVATFCKAPPGF